MRASVVAMRQRGGRLLARLVGWLEHWSDDLSTWKVLTVLVIGALFGLFILFFNFHWWDDRHRDFAGMSTFVLWAGLMSAQTALWALGLAWLLPSLAGLCRRDDDTEDVRRELFGRKSELWLSIAALSVTIGLFLVPAAVIKSWPNYMPSHDWKLGILTLTGVIAGLVAASGVWLTHGRLKQLLSASDLSDRQVLDEFLSLQSGFYRFLGTLGAILGLLVLATSAQRQTVLAYVVYSAPDPKHPPHIDYGYQFVLVYGLFFSILVAAVFLPTYLTSVSLGSRIRDAVFPPVAPTWPRWEQRLAKRETLGSLLNLQGGPFAQLKASIAILTPLLGSLVGLLLK